MVAAMPLQNDARPSEKTVTLRDLRRVAFGLSAAILIVMIAGAISDYSGSDSVSASELQETSVKQHSSIGIQSVATDGNTDYSEAITNGFTVTGISQVALGQTVTVTYDSGAGGQGIQTTCVTNGVSGLWTCTFAAGATSAVADATI